MTEKKKLREAVARFSEVMEAKLQRKRLEGLTGWDDPTQCPVDELKLMLLHHVTKEDFVDVANLAMMIWHQLRREER